MKNWMAIIGFVFFITGCLAIILSLVNVSFVFLRPIEKLGFFWAFMIKGILSLIGIVLVYLSLQKVNIKKL
ncbi:MAG: hypothetical protein IPM48_12470 [Saprospiraceae bacterium]|nr:hypothetical protein [Saprospiraceae bacterium]